jgi:hypothetical protein
MSKTVRVNVRSVVNMGAVRREKRNGRDVIIVPSATLPDDIVMNGIKYPADEIEKSYTSLNRTPAPYGHPLVNGRFVSASDPEGINLAYIGAHNENVRRENGRVFLDKVIDVEVANRTEKGKAVISAIDAGKPIHTSTGLLCNLDDPEGDDHECVARDIYFDHDAILLNEQGAATPDQGVGMLVNSKGEAQEIEVVNSSAEDAMRDLDWAVESAVRAMERVDKIPIFERIKTAIMEAMNGLERETSANNQEDADMVDEKQFEELSATVNALKEQVDGIGTTIAEAVQNAVKPLTDNLDEMKANQTAKDEAEREELVGKIVKANLMGEEAANELTLNAARELAKNAEPGRAAALANGRLTNPADDDWGSYDMNVNIDGTKKESA